MAVHASDSIAARAMTRAEAWQERANELLTHEEKGIAEQMRRLLTHPMDKVVLMRLIDQSFRSENPRRVADQVNSLLRLYGVPDFLSSVDKLLVQMFLGLGRHLPSIAVPKMIGKMRQDSSRAIIAGEPEALHAHLRRRRKQGVRMNINHLGEAILGEAEARSRLDLYFEDLKNPEIEYISVKISTIYSQIEPLAFEATLAVLEQRLARLYRVAQTHFFERSDGTRVPKFVNLDMEEYRDLEITCEAFVRTLGRTEFDRLSAGIVLQAYLPDAFALQQRLTRWAAARVARGGSPIRIRLVKGANMEMEQVDAALHNWPLAPYDNKRDVDANYKRMVTYGMQPAHSAAVRLGIASHNLFDLAYAYELALQNDVAAHFDFEMLEGMADHVRRALFEATGKVLLYAPVATRAQFINAIAYLVRRLDENTAPENFLRYAANLRTDSKEWRFLRQQFAESCAHMERAGTSPHRRQDRGSERFEAATGTYHTRAFSNEPDTDWCLPANRRWAEELRDTWRIKTGTEPIEVPLVVDGEELFAARDHRALQDPSRYGENIAVARYARAVAGDLARAVATARSDPDGWRRLTASERHRVLSEVARELRRIRGELIGAAAATTGKIFSEADVEVSEAIDFTEFYPFSLELQPVGGAIRMQGRGVGLVIAPWNFPIAIPCGGIAATLAAGNTVLFKPASDAVLVGWLLCRAFWAAGVSRKVLQFLPCEGAAAGTQLAGHREVDFVIFTGGTDTGMQLLSQRPDGLLAAETGGKNATIVTAMADRAQAVKNVVSSAFGHAGQKCSATSLLILEEEVYADPLFKSQLIDAAQSLRVGSVWDFENRVGPLIRPPKGDLHRALTTLESGESWALQPRPVGENPHLWTPGIKWDVQPGSFTHRTEFFGPLLGVMRARDLSHAIELANQTGYGLTAGLESLDRREQRRWRDGIRAGNLYINRGTTGAVTLRQPFGGMGRSALGAGIKAGGPNYVRQFMRFTESGPPVVAALPQPHPLLRLVQEWEAKLDWGGFALWRRDLRSVARAVRSYLYHYERHFAREHDFFHLRGQDNLLRYLPVGRVIVRVHPDDSLFDILARTAAARIAGCETQISAPPDWDGPIAAFVAGREGRRLSGDVLPALHSDDELIALLPSIERLRYAAAERVPGKVWSAAAAGGFFVAREPVYMEGRLELLHYFREQSICDAYHRYGNLGERGLA